MRRRLPLLVPALPLVLALAAPSVALAEPGKESPPYPTCDRTVTPAESETAHQRYIAGKADYDEANYESAIRRFRDAYEKDCTKHELLIIISAAYERKGDKRETMNALEAYLARVPNAPDAPTYRTKIENLKRQLTEQKPSSPPPPPPAQAAPPPEREEHTVYPWLVVGAGVVAVGVGIAVVATAPEMPPGCNADTSFCDPLPNETNGELEKRRDEAGRAKGQPLWGGITIGAGGALIAGGLLWHFLEPTGPKDRARLRPSVAPGFAGLSYGGTF